MSLNAQTQKQRSFIKYADKHNNSS